MFPEHIYTDMQAIEMTGVMLGSLAQWEPDAHFQAWQVGTAEGRFDVVIPSSDLSHSLLSQGTRPQRFQLIQWDSADGSLATPVVTEATPLADGYCTDYLPPDVCPVAEMVADARELIGSIATDPLRRFVHAVLEERHTCNRFWTMPASARHHHAHPGGLAQHSVEVAQDMATQGQLTGIERDLGIAGGLLHDIGKVWAYTRDMFQSEEGQAMGHELAGLLRLAPHLRELSLHWPDGGYAMGVLLSGCVRMRSDQSMPSALVARIRACDQRSCERSGSAPNRPGRSWIPKGWQPF
jgi:hypothetical protein